MADYRPKPPPLRTLTPEEAAALDRATEGLATSLLSLDDEPFEADGSEAPASFEATVERLWQVANRALELNTEPAFAHGLALIAHVAGELASLTLPSGFSQFSDVDRGTLCRRHVRAFDSLFALPLRLHVHEALLSVARLPDRRADDKPGRKQRTAQTFREEMGLRLATLRLEDAMIDAALGVYRREALWEEGSRATGGNTARHRGVVARSRPTVAELGAALASILGEDADSTVRGLRLQRREATRQKRSKR